MVLFLVPDLLGLQGNPPLDAKNGAQVSARVARVPSGAAQEAPGARVAHRDASGCRFSAPAIGARPLTPFSFFGWEGKFPY